MAMDMSSAALSSQFMATECSIALCSAADSRRGRGVHVLVVARVDSCSCSLQRHVINSVIGFATFAHTSSHTVLSISYVVLVAEPRIACW